MKKKLFLLVWGLQFFSINGMWDHASKYSLDSASRYPFCNDEMRYHRARTEAITNAIVLQKERQAKLRRSQRQFRKIEEVSLTMEEIEQIAAKAEAIREAKKYLSSLSQSDPSTSVKENPLAKPIVKNKCTPKDDSEKCEPKKSVRYNKERTPPKKPGKFGFVLVE